MISLSGEGHLEMLGWGYGGVLWLGWDLTLHVSLRPTRGRINIAGGGESKLEPKHELTVRLASQHSSKPFKEVHLSVCLTVFFNSHL